MICWHGLNISMGWFIIGVFVGIIGTIICAAAVAGGTPDDIELSEQAKESIDEFYNVITKREDE